MCNLHPPDVIHVIILPDLPRFFFASLSLLCIIVNAKWKVKTGRAWERGYISIVSSICTNYMYVEFHEMLFTSKLRPVKYCKTREGIFISLFCCAGHVGYLQSWHHTTGWIHSIVSSPDPSPGKRKEGLVF